MQESKGNQIINISLEIECCSFIYFILRILSLFFNKKDIIKIAQQSLREEDNILTGRIAKGRERIQ